VGGDVIARIRGLLLSSSPTCVVEVGGIGFEVHITEKDRDLLGRGAPGEVSFHTHLHVREDRLTLFGFLSAQDRELFTRLIEVTGVGPKTALGIMANEPAERIVRAVRTADQAFLCRLPGLGKRTAERLILELKDKLGDLEAQVAEMEPVTTLRDEAILALTSLGMPRHAAQRALERIDPKTAESSDLEAIIKEALKHAGSV